MKALKRFKTMAMSILFIVVGPNLSMAQKKCSLLFLNYQNVENYFHTIILPELRADDGIPIPDFKAIKKLRTVGSNNDGIFSAQLNGRKVFLKSMRVPSHYSPNRFFKEAAWTKVLSDLGMGPQFYGIARDLETNVHLIVTEFVDARKFDIYTAPNLSKEQINTYRAAVSDLAYIGIRPVDIQFYFTSNGGVRFFDPGYYEWHRPF